jgi:hypothetical protein
MGIIAASRLRGEPVTRFLNEFSGASLGLSLDLLDTNYTGFCIKVRRSNNDELDIGFVNGLLDTASLLTFVGSGNGFVKTIYDQVGSNNMTSTTFLRQGQIVSSGSIITLGGKPCIVRSANNSGGYISDYNPNAGVRFKGVFYVGDNNSKQSIITGSRINQTSGTGNPDYGFAVTANSTSTVVDDTTRGSETKINGSDTTIANRGAAFTATDLHFLLYRRTEFKFNDNQLGLGYDHSNTNQTFGMMTFQELVIFENTDDTVLKENNINNRYSIY